MTFEPGDTFDYTLERQFTIANSMTFHFKHTSARDSLKAAKIRDKFIAEHGVVSEESFLQLIEALKFGLVSFTTSKKANIEDLAQLLDHCTVTDLYELLNVVQFGPRVTTDEKKRSESQH